MMRANGSVLVWALLGALVIVALMAPCAVAAGTETSPGADNKVSMVAFAAAIVMSASCLAAAYAVARIGSAALGAASERPELLFRSLALAGLAEGLAILGFVIAIMIMNLLKP